MCILFHQIVKLIVFCSIRAEALASEIRDLQGELGDYNTVSYHLLTLYLCHFEVRSLQHCQFTYLFLYYSLWPSIIFTGPTTESSEQCCHTCPHKQKLDHVTPLLEKLHWLPVEARIHYKIATLAFRHFENSLTPYL